MTDQSDCAVTLTQWQECNHWHPNRERYYFSPVTGIMIQRGRLNRTEINYPINKIILRIDRRFSQTLFGLCDVSFLNADNGNPYGNEGFHNIRYESALKLRMWLWYRNR